MSSHRRMSVTLAIIGATMLVALHLVLAKGQQHGSAPERNGIQGSVFADNNSNGKRDPGEAGIPNVAVSDQFQVATTGLDGTFRLDGEHGYGLVFVSAPSGYRIVGSFWRQVSSNSREETIAFPLAPTGPIAEFIFLHASDTHMSEESLARLQRFRQLSDSMRPAFVLVTGDLVRDALRVPEAEAKRYYEMYMNGVSQFSVPVWSVPGNHDIFGIERDRSQTKTTHPLYGKAMYRYYLGPDYYSFNFGGVHFVGLNTVGYDDQWYYGHVDNTQLHWLEQDLSLLLPDTPVVTFNHIPFFSAAEILRGYSEDPPAPSLIQVNGSMHFRHTVSNAAEVLARLRKYNYTLALAGHVHMRERLAFETNGTRTRFHQASAVVGESEVGGMRMLSGITLYRVRAGIVDDGEFIPLDEPASAPHSK